MLSVLVWAPLLGALLISCLPQELVAQRARQVALWITGAVLLWTAYLASQFDLNQVGWQFREALPWIESLGLTYQMAVDGISMPLVMISSLLSWLAVFSSDRQITRPRLYYALLLTLSGAVAGAFLSQNLLLFFLFYEAELIPLYLMIAIWGGALRGYAATKFLIYTAVSGALILAAFFGLALLSDSLTFDYDVLKDQALPLATQLILLTTLLIGIGRCVAEVGHLWHVAVWTRAISRSLAGSGPSHCDFCGD
jgi:NAD(P)H-quinone oxidoreductase subunit 4